MAILEGLYWLQDALKLVVEVVESRLLIKEVASRLVGLAVAANFGVVAMLVEVAANPS